MYEHIPSKQSDITIKQRLKTPQPCIVFSFIALYCLYFPNSFVPPDQQ